MLGFNKYPGPTPKCFFTVASSPNFLNPDEPPTKRKPFTTVSGQKFSHELNILLPRLHAEAFQQSLAQVGHATLRYARVHMKLSDLLEGEFFNLYIKQGNILMRSQGRPLIDPVFTLSSGVLRLEIDKATFERIGLEGRVVPGVGRKHVKARYAIELNLRLPSMLHGKKGFERIVWAFRNVLSQTVTWLFYDLDGANDGTGPLAAHAPVTFTVDPHIENLDRVLVPDLPSTLDQENGAYAVEMLEWLTLSLGSAPCVRETGAAEAYLSRYQVPGFDDAEGPKAQDLVKLSYQGLLPSTFISTILLALLRKSPTDDNPWFVISAASFDGEAYAILRTGHRILIWKYMD